MNILEYTSTLRSVGFRFDLTRFYNILGVYYYSEYSVLYIALTLTSYLSRHP